MIYYLSSISINGEYKIYTIFHFQIKVEIILCSVIDMAEAEDSKVI